MFVKQANSRLSHLTANRLQESESHNISSICFPRFYYLFLGRTLTWVSEERFIRHLQLCGPLISGLVVTMHCVENLLFYSDHPTMFYYREGSTSAGSIRL